MNTQELIQWVEENFDCRMGPPGMSFDIPYSASEIHTFNYLRLSVVSDHPNSLEKHLVEVLLQDMQKILRQPIVPILLWRNPGKIQLFRSETHSVLQTQVCIPALKFLDQPTELYTLNRLNKVNFKEDILQ